MCATMLTVKQTAERSGLAVHFIRQLCHQGKICFVMAGNKSLINYEKFCDYLDTGDSPAPRKDGVRDFKKYN